MKNFKNIVIAIGEVELSKVEIVLLLDLLGNKIDINSISGMARSENKTPRGIRTSNKYRKIKFGDALLCVKDVTDDNLPF